MVLETHGNQYKHVDKNIPTFLMVLETHGNQYKHVDKNIPTFLMVLETHGNRYKNVDKFHCLLYKFVSYCFPFSLNRGSTAEVTEYISVNFGGTNSVFNVVG
jgi:hypothetical protein